MVYEKSRLIKKKKQFTQENTCVRHTIVTHMYFNVSDIAVKCVLLCVHVVCLYVYMQGKKIFCFTRAGNLKNNNSTAQLLDRTTLIHVNLWDVSIEEKKKKEKDL